MLSVRETANLQADLGDFAPVSRKVKWCVQIWENSLSRQPTFTTPIQALRPLQEKFHGLTDVETIYRKHVTLMISNRESFGSLSSFKNHFWNRRYLDQKGSWVETPVLLTKLVVLLPDPFIAHHNARSIDAVLRIATELREAYRRWYGTRLMAVSSVTKEWILTHNLNLLLSGITMPAYADFKTSWTWLKAYQHMLLNQSRRWSC